MRTTTILYARTVNIVRDLKVEKRQGINGEFESKDILFKIAVDRGYKTTRMENGQLIEENAVDYWLAKATGKLAQIFADNCCHKKPDGKLHSRQLLLAGSFENYKKARKVSIQAQTEINGVLYNIPVETEIQTDNTIFIVDEITFLDRNPAQQSAVPVASVVTGAAVPVTNAPVSGNIPVPAPVQSSTPVSQVAVQQTQTVVSQPATPQVVQPVAPAQTTPVQVAPVQVAQPVNAMNPPVVDNGFNVAGIEAPF